MNIQTEILEYDRVLNRLVAAGQYNSLIYMNLKECRDRLRAKLNGALKD